MEQHVGKRMGTRLVALLAAALLAAGLLAGCGAARHDGAAERLSSGAGQATAMKSAAGVRPTSGTGDSGVGWNLTVAAEEADAGAPVSPSSGVAAGTSAADPAVGRKIIYSASVDMEVADFDEAQAELLRLVEQAGGYMLHFSDRRTVRQVGGHFTMKVPADGFQSFLKDLESLKKGSEFRRSVRGEDVTEEFVDLSARLRAKEAVEARLLELMQQATEAKDLLEYSNELARVQEEIESYKGRIRYINENVAYSTVELHMYEVIDEGIRRPGDDKLAARAADAIVKSTEGVIRFLGDLLVFFAAALPVLALIALAGVPAWLAARRLWAKHGKRAAQAGTDARSRPQPASPQDAGERERDGRRQADRAGGPEGERENR